MTRFSKVLSDTDARLAVQEPARSRILLEIAADMEDLHGEYLTRGLSDEAAEAEVIDHFDLSEEVLRELVRVHDVPLERSLEKISGQIRETWSRVLMVLLALFVTVGSGSLLFRGHLYRDASGLVWILFPLLALGLVIAGIQARRLLGPGDVWSPRLHSGLGRLLALAGLLVGLTFAGLWVELYLSALRIREVPREALIHLVGWLHMASATLVIAISGALVLGFLWFFLETRLRTQELSAVAHLLEGSS